MGLSFVVGEDEIPSEPMAKQYSILIDGGREYTMAIGLHEEHKNAKTVDFSDVKAIVITISKRNTIWQTGICTVSKETDKAIQITDERTRFAWFPKSALVKVEKCDTTDGPMVLADVAKWFNMNEWQSRMFDLAQVVRL